MADRVWYFASGGNRVGPVSEDDLHARIASGEIKADTLVWNSGMADWAKAGAIPGLMGPSAPPMPPGASALPPTVAEADGGQEGLPLSTTVGTWGLFGRILLVIIGTVLVIPAPWVMTSFYRWFIPQIDLPNDRRVTFAGEAGEIWYIFMLRALTSYGGAIHQAVPLVLLFFIAFLDLTIIRWVAGKLRWEGQSEQLRFAGGYGGVLACFLAFAFSLITIIGWAWVATAATRWICRNIEGSGAQLSFVASGWGLLWRTIVFSLACAFVIPIPWMIAWYTRWMVSQFHLSARA